MMTELPDRLQSWAASGGKAQVDDTDVWYRVQGSGPWLVCLHGFPTSSWDWYRLAPALERRFRVLMFDFPGYGLSAKPPGRNYSLLRQVDAATALLEYLEVREFHLLTHDMGDTAACELMHRVQAGGLALKPRSWMLLNGGLYPDLHRPLPTQVLLRTPVLGALTARLSSWRVFMAQYPRVYADPDAFGTAHYEEQWSLILNNGGRSTLSRVACYMRERLRYRDRWEAVLHQPGVPLRAVWGLRDPIAVPAIAERLQARNPAVEITWLEAVGHYPQLEAPDRVAAAMDKVF